MTCDDIDMREKNWLLIFARLVLLSIFLVLLVLCPASGRWGRGLPPMLRALCSVLLFLYWGFLRDWLRENLLLWPGFGHLTSSSGIEVVESMDDCFVLTCPDMLFKKRNFLVLFPTCWHPILYWEEHLVLRLFNGWRRELDGEARHQRDWSLYETNLDNMSRQIQFSL